MGLRAGSNVFGMLDRLAWFATGVLTGGIITIRAFRRRPHPRDLRAAALATGADLLELTARLVAPPRRRLVRIR